MSAKKARSRISDVQPNLLKCERCGVFYNRSYLQAHAAACGLLSEENICHTFLKDEKIFVDKLELQPTPQDLKEFTRKRFLFVPEDVMKIVRLEIGQNVQIQFPGQADIAPIVRTVWFSAGNSVALSDDDQLDLPLEHVVVARIVNGVIPIKTMTVIPIHSIAGNAMDLGVRLKCELIDRFLHQGNVIQFTYFAKEFSFRITDIQSISVLNLEDRFANCSLNNDNSNYFEFTRESEVLISSGKDLASSESVEDVPKIGGLDDVLEKIEQIIENATVSKNADSRLHTKPRGVLLHGPSGCGKTMICTYLSRCARYQKHQFVHINTGSVFSKYLGESENVLVSHFESAFKNHPNPTIIIMDDIQIICRKNDTSDLNRRMVTALLSCLDRVATEEKGNRCVVIACTTQLEALDSSLLRSGRLDCCLEVPIPSPRSRLDILTKALDGLPHTLTPDDVQEIANVTHGFLGADLVSLLSKSMSNTEHTLTITSVNRALTFVKPSAMREILIEVPNIRWDDIGGQHELKLKLKQSIDWPLRNPEVFERFGIKPPKGVLMYGPPGCSKTMIAKALATESKLNFLSIKGPELFSMWVGESERAVRELFRKARAVSPSIIFFDEIDAIGGERSQGGSGGASVNERVLAQLLTEMDGVSGLDNVTIVAATNRPDMIDKALLRPGRIDRVIHVKLPDAEARREMFEIKLKKMPLDGADVDLKELVRLTEGYSGAEIQAICQEAALRALEESLEAADIKWRHFSHALVVVKPRTSKDLLDLYDAYENQFKERK